MILLIFVLSELLYSQHNNILGFKIERKIEGGNYEFLVKVSSDSRSFSDTTCLPNTTYYYRVCAYNNDGDSEYSNEAKVVTLDSLFLLPPLAPSNLTALSISTFQIVLSWVDNSTNETGFKIERKLLGGSYVVISTVSTDVTSYTDKNLISETTYYYRVCAYNTVGDSGYSNEIKLIILDSKVEETVAVTILHTPIEEINIPGYIKIKSEIKNSAMIQFAKILYKDKYSSEWIEQEMKYLGGDIWYGEISVRDMEMKEIEYKMEVFDSEGRKSNSDVYVIHIIPQKEEVVGPYGGEIKLIDGNPDDGESSVEIPRDFFSYNVCISFKVIDGAMLPLHNDGNKVSNCLRPVACYEITASQKMELTDNIILKLLYLDIDNDGREDISGVEENKLKIWWLDGDNWRYIGGKVDPLNNLVTVKVNRLGIYGIFPTIGLTGEEFRPKEKILMLSRRNSMSSFNKINGVIFNGIQNTGVKVNIYNIKGKKVRELSNIDVWDGKDENGIYVPSGVYIYQYEYRNQKFQGSIIVGR